MIDEKKPNIEKLLADEGIFSTGSFHFQFLKAYFLESKQNKKFSTKITNLFYILPYSKSYPARPHSCQSDGTYYFL